MNRSPEQSDTLTAYDDRGIREALKLILFLSTAACHQSESDGSVQHDSLLAEHRSCPLVGIGSAADDGIRHTEPPMFATSLSPCIITPKVEESRDFYVRHFGAKIAFDCGWYVSPPARRAIWKVASVIRPPLPGQEAYCDLSGRGGGWFTRLLVRGCCLSVNPS